MKSVCERIQSRRNYTVKVGSGDDAETFSVRALSIADRRRMDALPDVLEKSFFALGRGLLNHDGSECFPRQSGEDDSAYAQRIEASIPDIPTDTFNELCESINKIGITPKPGVLEKN